MESILNDLLNELKVNASSKIISASLTLVLVIILGKIILNFSDKALEKAKRIDPTITRFAKPLSRLIVTFIGMLFVANSLGFNTSSLVALFSVLSAAFALAAQTALSNLFGGFTLLATHPFVINDYISASDTEGTVIEIGMFYTVLLSLDEKRITIPNGTLSGTTITNYTSMGKRRVDLDIAVSYDCKMDDVKAAMQEAIASTTYVLLDDERFVHISNYGNSSITYTIRVWCIPDYYWDVYFNLMENVKRSFDKHNIIMTYDHIIVHQANN